MKYLNTTLGKYHILKSKFSAKSVWEHTRFRKKPPIDGGDERMLTNMQDVFIFNTWDHVTWDMEQEQEAHIAVAKNSAQKMSPEERSKIQSNADKFWDCFYDKHKNRFFKDRYWLFTEFPELAPESTSNVNQQNLRSIFELGCGVGNTILPILRYSTEPNLKVYGCDFSTRAIEILRSCKEYDAERCNVFVMDATLADWQVPFEVNSLDIIVLIFVLSAIEPAKMQRVVDNCYRYLRPGGLLVFRDYGRYDLAQLRFKSGKCLEDNFYVRGDGTMVYFFTEDEVRQLFGKAGFKEKQCIVDRRLQVNRVRLLKMYRVWIQTKFQKPMDTS